MTATAKRGRGKQPATRRVIGPLKASAGMPADGSWAKSVCDHLRQLAVGHARSTKRLTTLTNQRKAIEKELEEIGDGGNKRSAELKQEWYDNHVSIQNARAQVRWYGDRLAEVPLQADQGELFEHAKAKPSEDDLLFKPPPKNAWKKELIESGHKLEDRVIAALKKVEIKTWGDLAKYAEPWQRIEGLILPDIANLETLLKERQTGAKEEGDEDDEVAEGSDPLGEND